MMTLLNRLRTLYAEAAPEMRDLERAASLLNVKTFRLFEIAHREWFGREAAPRELERVFLKTFYEQSLPGWVRHFVRNILQLAARGRLDPRSYGLPPRQAEAVSVADLERISLTVYGVSLLLLVFAGPVLAAL